MGASGADPSMGQYVIPAATLGGSMLGYSAIDQYVKRSSKGPMSNPQDVDGDGIPNSIDINNNKPMYRDMPDNYVMGEDGKMYRINWEKLKPYAGAAAGAAVGMGMAVMGDNPANYGDAAVVTSGNIVPVMGGLGAAAGMALQHRKQIFNKNKRELPDEDMMYRDMPEQYKICLLYTSPSPRDS